MAPYRIMREKEGRVSCAQGSPSFYWDGSTQRTACSSSRCSSAMFTSCVATLSRLALAAARPAASPKTLQVDSYRMRRSRGIPGMEAWSKNRGLTSKRSKPRLFSTCGSKSTLPRRMEPKATCDAEQATGTIKFWAWVRLCGKKRKDVGKRHTAANICVKGQTWGLSSDKAFQRARSDNSLGASPHS